MPAYDQRKKPPETATKSVDAKAARLRDGRSAQHTGPRPKDPVAELRASAARAAADVASLEEATGNQNIIGALGLRLIVERFVAEASALLAMTGQADADLQGQVHAVLDRARAALEEAPRFRSDAFGAAGHGDGMHRGAELPPWPTRGTGGTAELGDPTANIGPAAGGPLPDALRSELEPALGASLSQVRVHTDAASASTADALDARAYAKGQDIHFGAGQYDPSSPAGRHLIAHEVAHTVQQQGTPSGVQCMARVSEPGDAAERQAENFAHAFVAGRSTEGLVTVGMQPDATIHRYGRDEHAALSTTHLIELYDFLRTPAGKKWAKDHGYANPEELIKRIEADPVVKTHKEPLKPGETKNRVAKLRGKSTEFSYGEITALMGDLFGDWQSLYNASETQRHHLMTEDSTASNEKHSNGQYLKLAANNDNHFAKKNQDEWLKLHTEAIALAKKAGNDDNAFNQALFVEAASTHFLTDAFSAGHQFEKGPLMAAIWQDLRKNPLVTQNREMQSHIALIGMADHMNIVNLIVKAIHDRMNVEGFEVTNGKGMKWKTIGDGHLSESPETQRIAALAVFESRQQIFEARGAPDGLPKVDHVRAFFPNDETIDRANMQAIGYIPEARKQVEQIVYHERKAAKTKLGEVGGYLVEHNLEAIGDPMRERNILQHQDFDRRHGGTGTAVGWQFQWRLGK